MFLVSNGHFRLNESLSEQLHICEHRFSKSCLQITQKQEIKIYGCLLFVANWLAMRAERALCAENESFQKVQEFSAEMRGKY